MDATSKDGGCDLAIVPLNTAPTNIVKAMPIAARSMLDLQYSLLAGSVRRDNFAIIAGWKAPFFIG